MADDDDFRPLLGRQRARGGPPKPRPALHAIMAAANLARGGAGPRGKRGFTGSRIGRGSGMGQVLASRDRFAAFRVRRVIVKARIVRLKGKGLAAAKAHLRYVERDGTDRSGERGQLYGAETDQADRRAFVERSEGDRHQFRFIVSPEDGADYEDLKSFTRRLMTRMEEDLHTRLDWVAADHFDTGHPHVHVVLRGRDDSGRDLVIARDYIRHGMRERAAEIVDLDLGPRSDETIRRGLLAEVEQERLTSIDRGLLRDVGGDGIVRPERGDPFQQTLRIGRLRQLERLGLAQSEGEGWRLAPDLAETLKGMGERGDVIRTMQRAYAARGQALPDARLRMQFDPARDDATPLVGRMVARGLADELEDRHYLVVDGTDGRSHFVGIGKGEAVGAIPVDAIVEISPRPAQLRSADHTIVSVAAANGGRYSVDIHLEHDAGASQRFAETHVHRLEAMRRALGTIEREPDGSWVIGSDHLDKAAAYEAIRARDQPVVVETLSAVPLERLVHADAATWLDRELTAHDPTPRGEAGFGGELGQALARRRQWLINEGLAADHAGTTAYAPDLTAQLRRRELLRVAGHLSGELGLRFTESLPGERIEGTYRRPVDLVSGRFALIEKSREFTLVPWRPVLERQVGNSVAGIMREGAIHWSIGRGRSGPSIS